MEKCFREKEKNRKRLKIGVRQKKMYFRRNGISGIEVKNLRERRKDSK